MISIKYFTKQITYLSFLTISFFTDAQKIDLTAPVFKDSIQANQVQLLDVRTADEYSQGHIVGAFQADWNNPEQFKERTASLDKEKTLYIYCLAGSRSAAAQKWLLQSGFKKVVNLRGGINAWNLEDFPLEGKIAVPQIAPTDFLNSLPKDKMVLVDIGADWCPPCKKMLPVIAELEQEGYTVIRIDGGSQTELVKALHAEVFPTFISFKNGKEAKRISGLTSKEELKELLD
ncbi:Thioredoxin [compost metagenome]